MDNVEKRMVDNYRLEHNTDYVNSLTDDEILQMCPPSYEDYEAYIYELKSKLTMFEVPDLPSVKGDIKDYESDIEYTKAAIKEAKNHQIKYELQDDLKNDKLMLMELRNKLNVTISFYEQKAEALKNGLSR